MKYGREFHPGLTATSQGSADFQGARSGFIIRRSKFQGMAKKIETVCGYSCSDCDHLGRECAGCEETKGEPFWTAYTDTCICPVYDCCVNDRRLEHCGKCPEMLCERFTRFKDPEMSPEVQDMTLARMKKELKRRK